MQTQSRAAVQPWALHRIKPMDRKDKDDSEYPASFAITDYLIIISHFALFHFYHYSTR
jgi:hypothetical protein